MQITFGMVEPRTVEIEENTAINNAAALSNPNIRISVVVTHPDVVALANAYATDSFTAYLTRVFNSIDEARSWFRLAMA